MLNQTRLAMLALLLLLLAAVHAVPPPPPPSKCASDADCNLNGQRGAAVHVCPPFGRVRVRVHVHVHVPDPSLEPGHRPTLDSPGGPDADVCDLSFRLHVFLLACACVRMQHSGARLATRHVRVWCWLRALCRWRWQWRRAGVGGGRCVPSVSRHSCARYMHPATRPAPLDRGLRHQRRRMPVRPVVDRGSVQLAQPRARPPSRLVRQPRSPDRPGVVPSERAAVPGGGGHRRRDQFLALAHAAQTNGRRCPVDVVTSVPLTAKRTFR